MGIIPTILDSTYVKNDYTLMEFALRFNDINFQMRIEYNQNQFEHYKQTEQLKKSGNVVFNQLQIGNMLDRKGFYKCIPIIFEGDKNNYFSYIFQKRVYLYEKNPNEFFEIKLIKGKYKNLFFYKELQ